MFDVFARWPVSWQSDEVHECICFGIEVYGGFVMQDKGLRLN